MTVEKSPAFQFYPKDFLSDEKQNVMSLAECGAYIRLLSQCWLEGSLPIELVQLARLCGATKRQMTEMWPALSRCFQPTDGRLIHPRLEREREKQLRYRQEQADKGKLSAIMRAKLAESRKLTVVEPRLNAGSISVATERQPESKSSSSSATPSVEQKIGPAAKAPSATREFLNWFQGEYKARRNGATYFVRWDAHGAIVKRLLTTFPADRLRKHAQILLTTDEDWTTGTDRGVEVLSAKINWLEERLSAWEAKRKAREAV